MPFDKGKPSSCAPWNKGKKYPIASEMNRKRIWTPEMRQKVSKALTGRKGRPAWNKGGKMPPFSKEHRKKIGDAHRGIKNHWWKGGISKSGGYILIASPNHPFKNKYNYVSEHRLVMEKHLGRYLKEGEIIHHINEDKKDNRIENLKLFSNIASHMKFHKSRLFHTCPKCGYKITH